MIAIDSSVLIDLLGEDAAMADAAEACVRDALARGSVVPVSYTHLDVYKRQMLPTCMVMPSK